MNKIEYFFRRYFPSLSRNVKVCALPKNCIISIKNASTTDLARIGEVLSKKSDKERVFIITNKEIRVEELK